jgi:hypothetical protein
MMNLEIVLQEGHPTSILRATVTLESDGEPPLVFFRGEWYAPTLWRTTDGRLVYKTEATLRREEEVNP